MVRSFVTLTLLLILNISSVMAQSPAGNEHDSDLPRVAIAGIAIESSTFSPAVTHEEAFHARVGEDVFSFYPFMDEGEIHRKRANWFPTLRGHALPGGIVTREAYESLVGKTLTMLEQNLPYDGLFFRYSRCNERTRA